MKFSGTKDLEIELMRYHGANATRSTAGGGISREQAGLRGKQGTPTRVSDAPEPAIPGFGMGPSPETANGNCLRARRFRAMTREVAM